MNRAVISGLILVLILTSAAQALMPLQYLMVHWQDGNNLSSTTTDAGVALIDTAAANGYNGFIQEDWRWEWYFNDGNRNTFVANAMRIRNECAAKKMVYLPAITPMGAGASLMLKGARNDAEGFPAKNVPMVVTNGAIVPVTSDPTNGDLANGFSSGFETVTGSLPTGWSWVDGWGTLSSLDTPGRDGTGKCLKMCNLGSNGGLCRINKTFNNLQPYRPYHIRLWIKTQNFVSPDSIMAQILTGGQGLQQATLSTNGNGVAATQGWTQYDLTFNTLSYTSVGLYIGAWWSGGDATCAMWVDDVMIEPLGFFNPISRGPNMRPKVTSTDGKTTYIEGKDYSKIGYEDYSAYPDVQAIWSTPQVVTALPGGRLTANGTQVLVTYHHMQEIGDWGQMCPCMSSPALYDGIAKDVHMIHADLNPSGYFFCHDEMREGGWDEDCALTGKTPGQILADNIRRCQSIVRKEIPPSSPGNGFHFPVMLVWNDMFDRYHNAQTTGAYYLVKGTGPWQNSWKGLTPELMILNWNAASANSQQWFSGNSNVGSDKTLQPVPCKQILSCDGSTPSSVDGPLATAVNVKNPDGSNGVIGVCYTVWNSDYTHIAAFATEVKKYCTLPPMLP